MEEINWPLFFLLIAICLPGLLVSIPNLIRMLESTLASRQPRGGRRPPTPVVILASMAQSLVLIALASAAGTALGPRVDLSAPFFLALLEGMPLGAPFVSQALPALLYGVGGAVVFVAFYYLYARPRMDDASRQASEDLRMSLGLASRLLYGGVVEEVLMRWGLMTALAWLGSHLAGEAGPAVMWAAILVSGILFGLGHLPGYAVAGVRVTGFNLAMTLALNLWGGLVFGWLFWQHGLLAAMLAHMLFHMVWYPLDRRFYRPAEAPAPAGETPAA